jgi:aryl-alcohol dehydrogenase-like predicted oxidoreductase
VRHLTSDETNQPRLPRRRLPGLDAEVSMFGAGCWTIGGPARNRGVPIGWDGVDPDAAYAGLVHAHELGITLYDTADVYGHGHSEHLLGRLLRETSRDDLVLSSKVGYASPTGRHPYEPAAMHHQFATTLDNLGTDHLDLYFLHSNDYGHHDQYLPGAIDTLQELRASGAIRAIGMRAPHTFAEEWVTSTRPEAAATARWLHLFHTVQPDVLAVRYNLLSPLHTNQETDIFTFARRHQVGVLIKQALGQGQLLHPDPPDPIVFSSNDHRSTDPAFTHENRQRVHERLTPLRARYGARAADLARVALRYVLHNHPEAPVLLGFRNAEQIRTTVTCLGEPLLPEEITEIRELLHPTT